MKCPQCQDTSVCNLIDVQTFLLQLPSDQKFSPMSESEEEWKEREGQPQDSHQPQAEERKVEEDPKTLAMSASAEIMSPNKIANVEETGYIGGKSSILEEKHR